MNGLACQLPVAWKIGACFRLLAAHPNGLSTPTQSETLGTDVSYTYLAENLIRKGAVDASACANNGLLPDGGRFSLWHGSSANCGNRLAKSI